MGFLDRLFGQSRPPETVEVPDCDSQIFGDEHYQENLAAIAGPKRESGYHMPVTIELRRDPEDSRDRNTIICLIDGLQVGEIKRMDAGKLQDTLRRLEKTGQIAAVDGFIEGGWIRRDGQDEADYRVRLAVDSDDDEDYEDEDEYFEAAEKTTHLEGSRNIRVVGVSYHRDAARRVVERNDEGGSRIEFTAALVIETDNPHDPNAVAVVGEGYIVGHLSSEDAAQYRPALARIASSGATITAPGTIYAGHRGGASWSIGVKLPTPKQLEAGVTQGHKREQSVKAPRAGASSESGDLCYVSTGESRADAKRIGWYAGKHYSKYVDLVKQLKRDGDLDAAAKLLQHLTVAVEQEASTRDWVPAPWYHDQLAIVYRKQGRYDAEVALIERFLEIPKALDSTMGQAFPARLEKARALQAHEQAKANKG